MDRIVQLESDYQSEITRATGYIRELELNLEQLNADNRRLREDNRAIMDDFARTREITERIYENEVRARARAKAQN